MLWLKLNHISKRGPGVLATEEARASAAVVLNNFNHIILVPIQELKYHYIVIKIISLHLLNKSKSAAIKLIKVGIRCQPG